MKAYRGVDDKIRLFRPEKNMARMNSSMERLYLPNFSGTQFLKCIEELLRIDKRFVPEGRGYSLYMRPTGISTHVRNALLVRLTRSPSSEWRPQRAASSLQFCRL